MESLSRDERRAARRIVGAKILGNLGDLLANAKTTLTWLANASGVPAWMTAMLVPIRESGSMLPQLWLSDLVKRAPLRKWVSFAGALGQALACLLIAAGAVAFEGSVAGAALLAGVGLFAAMRALSSISSKDVLGRTVPKGARGRVGGLGSAVAGLLGAGASLATMVWARDDVEAWVYAAIVAGAALTFAASGLAYALVGESRRDPEGRAERRPTRLATLWRDRTLRDFVLARGLLLGSALGGPFIVTFGQRDAGALSNLAAFVLAGGAASAASGWAWGRVADRDGRTAMALGAVVATFAGATGLLLALLELGGPRPWLWPLTYFTFSLGYAGVRVGRKTYVVDIADGDRRTEYVASSNTAIAVALLAFGALGAALQELTPLGGLALFTAMTAVGGLMSWRLDRSKEHPSSGAEVETQAQAQAQARAGSADDAPGASDTSQRP